MAMSMLMYSNGDADGDGDEGCCLAAAVDVVVVVAQHTERPVPPASLPSLLCLVAPTQTSISRKLSRTGTGNYFSFGQNDRHRRAENYFTWAP